MLAVAHRLASSQPALKAFVQMGNVAETQLPELTDGPLRPHTGLTVDHNLVVWCQLTGTFGQVSQRDAQCTRNSPKLNLFGFSHIHEHRPCWTIQYVGELVGR